MNDGNDDNGDCELAVTGILDLCGLVGKFFFNGIECSSEPSVIGVLSRSSKKPLMGIVSKSDEWSSAIIMSVLCAIITTIKMATRTAKGYS